jgi:hypothetical protein
MRRRSAVLFAASVCAALAAAAALPAAAGSSGAAPGFGVPRIVDPIHVYGEPDIAQNPKTGAIHASGPQGTGTQRSIWNVSVDDGDSYRIVQNVPLDAYPSGIIPTKSLIAPGGGDTEVEIAHNGRAFFNDLYDLACFAAITTTDDGATTSTANPDGCSDPGADRQWIALYDPAGQKSISAYKGPTPLAYMEYTGQVNGNDVVSSSTDGTDYSHHAGDFANDSNHTPNHTPIIVDQYTGDVLGMTTATSKGNDLALVTGKPDANGDLTFTSTDVAKNLAGDPQTLFPVLTEDTARTLYAVWVDHTTYRVWYTYSKVDPSGTSWTHWSAPKVLSRAPANVNVFPWAAAGGPGILDVAWYGTSKTMAQLGSAGPSARVDQRWDLYFSQLTSADGSSPNVQQLQAAPHAMHYNDICLLGTLCISGAGNRNQADFFKLIIGKDGRARIVYTDSSNRLSQTVNNDTAADHQGAALDTVVTQERGVNAWTGAPLTARESTAPRSSITDPSGDALFKPLGGTNVPSADITGLKLTRDGSNLVIKVTTAKGTLADAAQAAATPFAELTVRWQMGDTLYHAGVEEDAVTGTPRFYAGQTKSTDLCSVSGCKPNYLTYDAAPAPNAQQIDGSVSGTGPTTYTLNVPLAAIGNPSKSRVLEEVMGFVTVSPQTVSKPLDNVTAFADIVPLQIEGTKTFNFAGTAAGATSGSGSSGGNGSNGGNGSSNGGTGSLAATGLATAIPVGAVVLLLSGLALLRRSRA